jgi:ion channel-forming bestrophin family protein
MRLHLRKQKELFDELAVFLPVEELDAFKGSANPPNAIVQRQGERLRDLYERGLIDDFRHMQLDDLLTELTDVQGGCERIKNTPLPRQYDFYPRLFVFLYTFLLPFGFVKELGWLTLLVSVPTSFMFYSLEGVGRANEDPFENRPQDTPMSALCRTIEINLREQLGEKELPPPLQAVDGYLF